MKQPKDFELKKWLCNNLITGVKVHYYQTGTDTSDTDWELFSFEGNKKRVKMWAVQPLLKFDPNWVKLMQVKDEVVEEVTAYEGFCIKEARDLAAYKRLKTKFDGSSE